MNAKEAIEYLERKDENSRNLCWKADGIGGSKSHKFRKKHKLRIERRRAKNKPNCIPGYKKLNGWES